MRNTAALKLTVMRLLSALPLKQLDIFWLKIWPGLLDCDLCPGVGHRGWVTQLSSLYDQDFRKEDNVEEDDDDDWDPQEPVTVTEIHPAMIILLQPSKSFVSLTVFYLMKNPVDAVGNNKYTRTDPTKNTQNFDQKILLKEIFITYAGYYE